PQSIRLSNGWPNAILKPTKPMDYSKYAKSGERGNSMEFRIRRHLMIFVTGLSLFLMPTVKSGAQAPTPRPQDVNISVGVDEVDFRGNDQKALQAAVDFAAKQGGGIVHVRPGKYHMRNALILRDNVKILGVPGKTVLIASDGIKMRLAVDGDCNERQITLED